MSRGFTEQLYDSLHDFESRYRRGTAYPVHKRLRFDDRTITDVYDWIATAVPLPDAGDILDAGCGVGFGSLRMAEKCSSRVVGISLSSREIASAKYAAEHSSNADQLDFRQQSFDAVAADSFDLVVAVESLKHSENLAATLDVMHASLRSGGRMVIIEDCYDGSHDDGDALRLAKCWGLRRLYSEADFRQLPTSPAIRVVDLTRYIQRPGLIGKARRALAPLFRSLARAAVKPEVRAAFTGGEHLERLYASGSMQYKALICDKAPHSGQP